MSGMRQYTAMRLAYFRFNMSTAYFLDISVKIWQTHSQSLMLSLHVSIVALLVLHIRWLINIRWQEDSEMVKYDGSNIITYVVI